MNDEFARELAHMALVLHEQPDIELTAERFLEYVLARIGTQHASVLLLLRGGRLESAAATDARVEEADRVQLETGEGPSFSAIQDEKSVVSGDFPADPRWPRWSAGTTGVGLHSVLSVRLRTPATTVGALNLYAPDRDRFTKADDTIAQLFADHAAVAVANARSESTLWQAIEARKLIGQAQGILMERFDLTAEQAFAVLRRYSQDNNVKLRDVAARLIATRKLS
ncbi:GAF and ANTAR domain-containing protein [Kribbella amoyensis]|uniref:GAF and ANTAR domain-containing protein n=1 Tax=Kribbella amoyensis TaxID=996641 RepID=UPI001478BAB9|nr:GAF and ANTAR domain-containing protein [Kribbella amoyensis]